MGVEPVPGEPAAVAEAADRTLVVADYHAGLEAALRRDGVELPSRAAARREHLLDLLEATDVAHLLFLGDLSTAIGTPRGEEREELVELLDAIGGIASVTVVKGNHDGAIERIADDLGADVTVTPTDGVRLGEVGFAHGHTWPRPDVLSAATVCTAHEHPMVRLEDEVGGTRIERVWLRGRLASSPFDDHYDRELDVDGELVVFPAFNERVGGTWINAERGFLSPFLPDGLADGEAYLLDGTRLGPYVQL